MNKKHLIIYILALTLIFACRERGVAIGNGPPDKEFTKCTNLLEKKKYEDAVQCLEMFKAKFPNSEEAILAELKIGDSYLRQKDYLMAADSYEMFLKLYPYSKRAQYAHYKAGLAYSKEAPKSIDRDQEYLKNAEYHLKMAAVMPGEFQNDAINELKSVQNRILKRQYYIGRFYYKRKQYVASRPRFRDVVNTAPDSILAPQSLYYLVKASIEIGEMEDARTYFTFLKEQYPKNRWTAKSENKLLNASRKDGVKWK